MELFDKKYLHCIYSEEIDGKKCLLSDDLIDLIKNVNSGKAYDPNVILACGQVIRGDGPQITAVDGTTWIYAYYDHNYECKVAYNEGKEIEYSESGGLWYYTINPKWRDGVEYRIKPEELKCMTYRQLSEWLAHGKGQIMDEHNNLVCTSYGYMLKEENDRVPLNIKVRRWGDDEWHEATKEYLEGGR